ncbi:MAG: DNA primase [Verrucomicrobiales bacterium]|jgi:DNA primase|nr:DNA primase [Verrucomicrobiales bacterium]MDP5004471.1 DNA primase [Verrucomicrobiales bacterium]
MAIIPQETVQEILDATDIVELIQGYFPLKRAGTNYLAICPFHNEKSPSFNINPQRQIFHCFGCQAGGDAIKFMMLYDNLSFPEAAKKLAGQVGVVVREEVLDPKEEARQRGRSDILRLQKAAADWFHRLLFKSPAAQEARDYLKSRGLTMETSRTWKFGYAPTEQKPFIDWARDEGFSIAQLVEGGLAKWREENNPHKGAYSFFRHRLMFPVNNDFGEPIAFSGRVLSKDQGGGKYVNSPETVLFSKSKTFFGLDKSKRAILREKRAVICEGQLDLIAAYEAGIENIVAPLGTAFTPDHARILKRHTDEVVLCFDSDTAGLNAASKAFRILAPSGMLIRLALLPEGEDPDSLIRKQGIGALREILESAPEFFDFQIDRRGGQLNQGSLRERLNFARDLSADIALIEDKMMQDSLISRVTIRLGVGEDDIRKLVRDAIAAKSRTEKAQFKRDAVNLRRQSESSGRPERGGENRISEPVESDERTAPIEITNRSIRLLCRGILIDAEIRKEITEQPIPDFFRNLTETEVLAQVWQANFDPASPASVNAFVGQLGPAEQHCVNRLLSDESARITPELARDCLTALRKQSIQRQISVTKAQLGAPGLPENEVTLLSKVLLDLRELLNEC